MVNALPFLSLLPKKFFHSILAHGLKLALHQSNGIGTLGNPRLSRLDAFTCEISASGGLFQETTCKKHDFGSDEW